MGSRAGVAYGEPTSRQARHWESSAPKGDDAALSATEAETAMFPRRRMREKSYGPQVGRCADDALHRRLTFERGATDGGRKAGGIAVQGHDVDLRPCFFMARPVGFRQVRRRARCLSQVQKTLLQAFAELLSGTTVIDATTDRARDRRREFIGRQGPGRVVVGAAAGAGE